MDPFASFGSPASTDEDKNFNPNVDPFVVKAPEIPDFPPAPDIQVTRKPRDPFVFSPEPAKEPAKQQPLSEAFYYRQSEPEDLRVLQFGDKNSDPGIISRAGSAFAEALAPGDLLKIDRQQADTIGEKTAEIVGSTLGTVTAFIPIMRALKAIGWGMNAWRAAKAVGIGGKTVEYGAKIAETTTELAARKKAYSSIGDAAMQTLARKKILDLSSGLEKLHKESPALFKIVDAAMLNVAAFPLHSQIYRSQGDVVEAISNADLSKIDVKSRVDEMLGSAGQGILFGVAGSIRPALREYAPSLKKIGGLTETVAMAALGAGPGEAPDGTPIPLEDRIISALTLVFLHKFTSSKNKEDAVEAVRDAQSEFGISKDIAPEIMDSVLKNPNWKQAAKSVGWTDVDIKGFERKLSYEQQKAAELDRENQQKAVHENYTKSVASAIETDGLRNSEARNLAKEIMASEHRDAIASGEATVDDLVLQTFGEDVTAKDVAEYVNAERDPTNSIETARKELAGWRQRMIRSRGLAAENADKILEEATKKKASEIAADYDLKPSDVIPSKTPKTPEEILDAAIRAHQESLTKAEQSKQKKATKAALSEERKKLENPAPDIFQRVRQKPFVDKEQLVFLGDNKFDVSKPIYDKKGEEWHASGVSSDGKTIFLINTNQNAERKTFSLGKGQARGFSNTPPDRAIVGKEYQRFLNADGTTTSRTLLSDVKTTDANGRSVQAVRETVTKDDGTVVSTKEILVPVADIENANNKQSPANKRGRSKGTGVKTTKGGEFTADEVEGAAPLIQESVVEKPQEDPFRPATTGEVRVEKTNKPYISDRDLEAVDQIINETGELSPDQVKSVAETIHKEMQSIADKDPAIARQLADLRESRGSALGFYTEFFKRGNPDKLDKIINDVMSSGPEAKNSDAAPAKEAKPAGIDLGKATVEVDRARVQELVDSGKSKQEAVKIASQESVKPAEIKTSEKPAEQAKPVEKKPTETHVYTAKSQKEAADRLPNDIARREAFDLIKNGGKIRLTDDESQVVMLDKDGNEIARVNAKKVNEAKTAKKVVKTGELRLNDSGTAWRAIEQLTKPIDGFPTTVVRAEGVGGALVEIPLSKWKKYRSTDKFENGLSVDGEQIQNKLADKTPEEQRQQVESESVRILPGDAKRQVESMAKRIGGTIEGDRLDFSGDSITIRVGNRFLRFELDENLGQSSSGKNTRVRNERGEIIGWNIKLNPNNLRASTVWHEGSAGHAAWDILTPGERRAIGSWLKRTGQIDEARAKGWLRGLEKDGSATPDQIADEVAAEVLARQIVEGREFKSPSSFIGKAIQKFKEIVEKLTNGLLFEGSTARRVMSDVTSGRALRREGMATGRGAKERDFKTWHGTPHVWPPEPGFPHGRPRLDKIGSGEGADAYGWGWYSAEKRDVADTYRNFEEKYKIAIDGSLVSIPAGSYESEVIARHLGLGKHYARSIASAISVLREFNGNQREAIRALKTELSTTGYLTQIGELRKQRAIEVLEKYGERFSLKENTDGSVYNLDVPNDVSGRILDYDSTENTESLIDNIAKHLTEEQKRDFLFEVGFRSTFEKYGAKNELNNLQVYNRLSMTLGGNREASLFLRDKLGIVGGKYLDQGSRGPEAGKDPGSYNYVIWDQSTLDRVAVLERNGKVLDQMRSENDTKENILSGRALRREGMATGRGTKERYSEASGATSRAMQRYAALAEKYSSGTITDAERKEAEEIVYEKAKMHGIETGSTVIRAWHQSLNHGIGEFRLERDTPGSKMYGIYFSMIRNDPIWGRSDDVAEYPVFLFIKNPRIATTIGNSVSNIRDINKFLENGRYDSGIRINDSPLGERYIAEYRKRAVEAMSDGSDPKFIPPPPGAVAEVVVLDPSMIKSAEAFTKDDSGKYISLSDRFNKENRDHRFQYSGPVTKEDRKSFREFRKDYFKRGKWRDIGQDFERDFKASGERSPMQFYKTWKASNPDPHNQTAREVETDMEKYHDIKVTPASNSLQQRVANIAKGVASIQSNLLTFSHYISPKLGKLFRDSLDDAHNERADVQLKASDILKKGKYKKLYEAYKPDEIIFTDLGGRLAKKVQMTKGEFASIVRYGLSESGAKAITNKMYIGDTTRGLEWKPGANGVEGVMKWAQSEIEKDPTLKQLNKVLDDVTEMIGTRIKPIAEKLLGIDDWTITDHYQRLRRLVADPPTGQYDSIIGRLLQEWRPLAKRQNSTRPVVITDAFRTFAREIYEGSHFIGYADKIDNLRRTIGASWSEKDPEATGRLGTRMDERLGKGTYRRLKDMLQQVEGTGGLPGDAIMNKLMGLQDITRLSGIGTVLKQLGALPLPYADYSTSVMSKMLFGTSDMTQDFARKVLESRNGRAIALRVEEGHAFDELAEQRSSGKTAFGRAVDKIRPWAFAGMRAMDKFTIYKYVQGAYEHIKETRPDLKGQELVDAVAKEASRIMNDYQPTGRADTRSQLHNYGWIGRSLNRYRTSPNAAFNTMARMWMDYSRGDEQAGRRLAGALAGQLIMAGTFAASDELVKAIKNAINPDYINKDPTEKKMAMQRDAEDAQNRGKILTGKVIDTLASQVPYSNLLDGVRQSVIEFFTSGRKGMYDLYSNTAGTSWDPLSRQGKEVVKVLRDMQSIRDLHKRAEDKNRILTREEKRSELRQWRSAMEHAINATEITGIPLAQINRLLDLTGNAAREIREGKGL